MAIPLLAAVIPFALRFLVPAATKALTFAITKPKTTIALGLGVPAAIGFTVGAPGIVKQLGPKQRFEAAKEFGEKLTGAKPSDGGDLIKSGAKAAGILGAVVGAAVIGKKILEKKPKEKVISDPAQLVPAKVLPSMEPIGPVLKDKEEKIVQPLPSIINRINVTPIVNVKINQSRKFINQQLLVRA